MLNTFVSGSLISQEVQYSTVKRIRAFVGNEVVAIEYDQLGIRDMVGYKPGMFIFDHVFSPGEPSDRERSVASWRFPVPTCVQGINMIILSECIHLPCEIVTVLTVSMQQDQRLALAFFYEMMLDVHVGMSCDPESATFASPEYSILDPNIEPTFRLKLRKNE